MPKEFSKDWYHNKGEMDSAKGKHDSPRPDVLDHFTTDSKTLKEREEKADAYSKGWNNARKQK